MDSRSRKVQEDVKARRPATESYTPEMLAYHAYLSSGEMTSDDYAIAFSIHEDPIQKELLESLLFSNCVYSEITKAFEVPSRAVTIYACLFFDVSKFRTRLEKISYLENYPDKLGKELKIRAFNLGPEFILFNYANLVPKTSAQRDLINRIFMASAYKAMSMNYNGINSTVTKNAVEHAKLMIKAYEVLEKFSFDEGNDANSLVKIVTQGLPVDDTMMPIPQEDIV